MEGRLLFEQATLAVTQGMKMGLVGRNGTGKSTLFRLVKNEISPDEGSINLRKSARLGVVDQNVPDGPESLFDTVLAADKERAALLAEAETAEDPARIAHIHTRLADINAYNAEARAGAILSGLGFSGEEQVKPCADFSGGWRMRVALAAMLFAQPDLLLLDEPTNYLDVEGGVWLENHIRTYPGTAFIISHDREFLNRAVTHIAHLRDRKLFAYSGGYDTFEKTLREQQRLSMALRDKQEDERRRLEAFVTRFKAKASKARQAQSRVRRLEKMRPVPTIIDEPIPPIDLPSPERSLSPPIMRFDDVALGYEDDAAVLERINIRIDPDDRIGILGKNGKGKSTFAKALTGLLEARDGLIKRHKKLAVGYFAQHQIDALNPKRSAYDHVIDLMPEATEAQRRARLARFGLGHEKAGTQAGKLSGGEMARLLFSLISFGAPHLLVLDEPVNHLDMDSRAELINALNVYEGAVVVISHDRNLLGSVVNHLWLVDHGTVSRFEGSLEDYRQLQLEKSKPAKSDKTGRKHSKRQARIEAAARPMEPGKEPARRPVYFRRRLEKLEADMDKAKTGMAKIDHALSIPSFFTDNPERAVRLSHQRMQFEAHLEKLERAWLEVSEEAEAGISQ